jgi:hypothetical protein
MESKPTIEQFMSNFFRERTAALKLQLEINQVYWRRFYHSECDQDSRRGVVERSEAEEIVSVSSSDIGAGVVTTGHGLYRSRYQVKSSGECWLIYAVDTECAHCSVHGASADCVECGGTGWQSWKDRAKSIEAKCAEHLAAPTSRGNPDEELGVSLSRDPAIEHFMNDHFRERTLAWKKEAEIYGDYVKRFYSPECDWTRFVVSAQSSEAEKIVSIVPVDSEAQLTTRVFGFREYGLRYHVRPAGQSWLIWEVDMECPMCVNHGRTANCILCGGTGWNDTKAKKWRSRGKPPGEEPPPE